MKKQVLALAVLLAATFAQAQGTVIFNNRDTTTTPPINARIFLEDGVTGAGSIVVAQLWASAPGGSLAPVGNAIALRDGAGAGYINITGQDLNRVIPGVAGGAAADIQMRAWTIASGATYELASLVPGALIGQSAILNLAATGGAGAPATLPVPLIGLQGFSLTVVPVPEPSVIALALIGAGALFFRRKKA